jgi:hypothetical protein
MMLEKLRACWGFSPTIALFFLEAWEHRQHRSLPNREIA